MPHHLDVEQAFGALSRRDAERWPLRSPAPVNPLPRGHARTEERMARGAGRKIGKVAGMGYSGAELAWFGVNTKFLLKKVKRGCITQ